MGVKKEEGRKWDGKSRVSNDNYRERWEEIFGQKITKAPSIWYPEWEKRRYADKRYVDES